MEPLLALAQKTVVADFHKKKMCKTTFNKACEYMVGAYKKDGMERIAAVESTLDL